MDLNKLIDTPPSDWPDGTAEELLRTLVDQKASQDDRVIAAELSELVIDDAIADALVTVVASHEESEELRGTAVISLGPALEIYSVDAEDPEAPEPPIGEYTFRNIQNLLERIYLDLSNSKEVRRRVLEAAVHAPELWQSDAIKEAWKSGDKEWMTTAAFAMRWYRGFNREISEALENDDPNIFYQGVKAAGGWSVEAAWPVVIRLITDPETPKPLLLAAIEAVGNIRPEKADELLIDFVDSSDPEISDTAAEAITVARVLSGDPLDDPAEGEIEGEEEGPVEWIN